MPAVARYMNAVEQALSIKYNNLVYEWTAQGRDIIVLSLGEAFFDIPLFPFDDLPFPAVYHYTHSRGIPVLREQLAAYYGSQYNVPVDPAKEVVLSAGSKIAIYMALMAIVDHGDEVLIHEPAWVSYTEQVKLCHGTPVTVPCDVPVTELERFVTPRTKAIILNSPHNPTGATISREQWKVLHELAARRDLFLICDEAYSDFTPSGAFVSGGELDPKKDHTIVCNSMSKNYGMSGWRIGYVLARPDVTDHLLKVNQHLITCPSSILQFYISKHFDDILSITKPQIADLLRKRNAIGAYMDSIGLHYLPGVSTFYHFVSLAPSRLGSEAFCQRLLNESGVAVVPGVGYGQSCDRFVRMSCGTESNDRVQHGLNCIKQLIDATA
jgi:aminotransferase